MNLTEMIRDQGHISYMMCSAFVCLTKETNESPKHVPKKCIQDNDGKIKCEDLKTDAEAISQWPPGPYVLAMTRYGCPESSNYGWREGYLYITWRESQGVLNHIRTGSATNANEMMVNITGERFYSNSKSHIFGTITESTFKLQFCYKYRENSSVDIGTWPDGNYVIFGTDAGCPPEFERYTSNFSLPKVAWWTSDGYLPDFKILNDDTYDILHMSMCSRIIFAADDNETAVEEESTINWISFFLIANENSSCPTLATYWLSEETLYLEQITEGNTSLLKIMDTFCYYQFTNMLDVDAVLPELMSGMFDVENLLFGLMRETMDVDEFLFRLRNDMWDEIEILPGLMDDMLAVNKLRLRSMNAYKVEIASITEGSTSIQPIYDIDISKFPFLHNVWSGDARIPWKVIDLGGTIEVSGLRIYFRNEIFNRKCTGLHYRCHISNGKYNFLHWEAVSCLFVSYCSVGKDFLFMRPMEGRFLLLYPYKTTDSLESMTEMKLIEVLTEKIMYDKSSRCNMDLGMSDFRIKDDQISASSSISGFPPVHARPYSSGWCAQVHDMRSYLKVVSSVTEIEFPNVIRLDGITIYNWEKVFLVDQQIPTKISSFGVTALTLWFADYKTDTHTLSKTINVSTSRTFTEPQTFWLLEQINAKVVQIFIQKSAVPEHKCMRLELHGCMNDGYRLVRTKQSLTTEKMSLISEVYDIGNVITSIGFPGSYDSFQTYRWIVRYPDISFIKLVFTHLSFNRIEKTSDTKTTCFQSLMISYSFVNTDTARVIDNTLVPQDYDDFQSLTVETKVTQLVMTFSSCTVTSQIDRGSGFKAIVTSQDIPACFSLHSNVPWQNGLLESCDQHMMFLTSMSYLGFPFVSTNEQWNIYIPAKRIRLQIVYFHVTCGQDSESHVFKVINLEKEDVYCNLNRPPGIIYSSYDRLTIFFHNDVILSHAKYSDSFRMLYVVIQESEYRLIQTGPKWKLRNIAFGKAAIMLGGQYQWITTDGVTHQDPGSRAVITNTCTSSAYENEPWWMLDLQNNYILDHVVIHFRHGYTPLFDGLVLELYTSLNNKTWRTTGYLCGNTGGGNTVSQVGLVARYVKLKTLEHRGILTICEVMVYGNPEPLPDAVTSHNQVMFDTCNDSKSEEGEYVWSRWEPCSSECGAGLKSRLRSWCVDGPTGRKCYEDLFERRACKGNGSCPICSDTFGKCYSIISKLTNWKQARLECWRRNMQLVSILSLKEMRFIKYILRNRRKLESLPNHQFGAEFYVHLGLRMDKKLKDVLPVWENELVAIFTAWNKSAFSNGNCTRMNFKLFDSDNTWETTNCEASVSEFIMCEYRPEYGKVSLARTLWIWKDEEIVEVPERVSPMDYNYSTNLTVTLSGNNCSFCRFNPNTETFFCALTPEECSVNLPAAKNPRYVYYKYLGDLSKTFTGKDCQRWDSQFPHEHSVRWNYFKGEGISDAANYCRDPWDTGYLWCFTRDFNTRWEPCILKDIKAERRCINRQINGTTNTTVSGKTCLRWEEQQNILVDSSSENYCRDPLNLGYSWCYINSPNNGKYDIEMEPCEVVETRDAQNVDNTSPESTPGEMFMCKDGNFTPMYFRCNSIFDCEDMSDETDCSKYYSVHPMVESTSVENVTVTRHGKSLFQCKTKEFISLLAHCNGVIDCLDASDETDCSHDDQDYKSEQFRCDDGDVIHISQVCNFVIDCIDSSDEYCDFEQCSTSEFRCNNGQCIPLKYRCDVVRQCIDGSDETFCAGCQQDMAFLCDFSRCLPLSAKCDSYVDCEDRTDEQSCDVLSLDSCKDWWEAGYRKSGTYIVGITEVVCKFEYLKENITIMTLISMDLFFANVLATDFYPSDDSEAVFYHFLPFERNNRILSPIFSREKCTHQLTLKCKPTFQALVDFKEDNSECYCGIYSLAILQFSMINPGIDVCPEMSYKKHTISKGRPKPPDDYQFFEYRDKFLTRGITSITNLSTNYQVTAGPAICRYDYMVADEQFACDTNGLVIPLEQKCIFEIGNSGFPIGCRDGSHLSNCENFTACPRNYVKCPGSYCIPFASVCDGTMHCPRGEDEAHCGCTHSHSEIIIIYDEDIANTLDVREFAKQFKAPTIVIRLLRYKASKPFTSFGISRSLLEISDIEIFHRRDIENEFECRYKILAGEFLNSVHFTNDGIKGVILMEHSETSAEVNTEILENLHMLQKNLTVYRVAEESASLPGQQPSETGVRYIRVRRLKWLSSHGAEYFSEVCNITTKVYCPHRYKCKSSKVCIPMEQICDGYRQCVHGDDELLCDFQCPYNCSCAGFYSNCRATNFDRSMVNAIPKNTRHLDLSLNTKLSIILQEIRLNFMLLIILNVSSCRIEKISRYAFGNIRNLRVLDLSFNILKRLSNYQFTSLLHLRHLNLQGNVELSFIEQRAFDGLSFIKHLDLANSKLRTIAAHSFAGLKLNSLDMSNNRLEAIEDSAFSDASVEVINFENNDIKQFDKGIFTGLVGLKILKTPAFKFCCVRPNYVRVQDCSPSKDEFSSCEDLMRLSALQFMLWFIAVLALLGNFLTLIYRIKLDRKRLKLGFGIFVTNLAVADFLMGIYLLIIAVADAAFRKRYIYFEDMWRNSVWCKLAGVLSTISSEASVLFLCLITIDRLLVIKFPFGGVRFTTNNAVASTVLAWLFSIFVATLPVFYKEYFKDMFYSKSGVCIALPLTRDRPPGWAYSLAIFVGLNFVTFILVAFGQLSIFIEMKRQSGATISAGSTRKRNLKVARNLLLVVASDFMCWFPIGIMALLALSGRTISGEVYAWAAVFLLPVNSALNPILYTLSSILGGKNFRPSDKEQDMRQITEDRAQGVLQFSHISNRLTMKNLPVSKYIRVDEISGETSISTTALLRIAKQLVECIDTLHSNSLAVKGICEKSVYVRVRDKALTGAVKIKGEIYISDKPEDAVNNMYLIGSVVRCVMALKKSG